jgi:hypothetical protein
MKDEENVAVTDEWERMKQRNELCLKPQCTLPCDECNIPTCPICGRPIEGTYKCSHASAIARIVESAYGSPVATGPIRIPPIAPAVETGLTDVLWARLMLGVAVLGWLGTVALVLLAIWGSESLSTRYSNTAWLAGTVSLILTCFAIGAAVHSEENSHADR